MKQRNCLAILMLGALGFSSAAFANTAIIESNKAMTFTYRVAHQKAGQPIVYEVPQTITIKDKVVLPLTLGDNEVVGIVPIVIDNKAIPANVTEFNKPERCSITTNKEKSEGRMLLSSEKKQATCKIGGGVFS